MIEPSLCTYLGGCSRLINRLDKMCVQKTHLQPIQVGMLLKRKSSSQDIRHKFTQNCLFLDQCRTQCVRLRHWKNRNKQIRTPAICTTQCDSLVYDAVHTAHAVHTAPQSASTKFKLKATASTWGLEVFFCIRFCGMRPWVCRVYFSQARITRLARHTAPHRKSRKNNGQVKRQMAVLKTIEEGNITPPWYTTFKLAICQFGIDRLLAEIALPYVSTPFLVLHEAGCIGSGGKLPEALDTGIVLHGLVLYFMVGGSFINDPPATVRCINNWFIW